MARSTSRSWISGRRRSFSRTRISMATQYKFMSPKETIPGGAQPNISREKIIHTIAPLPPFEEQKRIVAKVNQLMALCDELEAKLRQAEADGEKLMNAAVQHVLASISETSTSVSAGASV